MEYSQLIETARQARLKAYAPYSKFKVGAALRARDGRVFAGCNVENAAYGLCNCAERTAFFAAIAAGYGRDDFEAIAVIADTEQAVTPCGACRQVMVELASPALTVVLSNLHGAVEVTTPAALLPGAFTLAPTED